MVAFAGGERAANRQHLRLIISGRVMLGVLEQGGHLRPVLKFLRLLQGLHQALRIMTALPAGDREIKRALWIGQAVQGDQLALFAKIQRAFECQEFFQRNLQLGIKLEVPGQNRPGAPVRLVGDGAVIHLQHVPGRLFIGELQVSAGPVDALGSGQRKTFGQLGIGLRLGGELAAVFQVLQQASPGLTLLGVLAHITGQPARRLGLIALCLVAVQQRIEFDVGQRALGHDLGEQGNHPRKIRLLASQTPGVLAGLRVFTQVEQTDPVVQRGLRLIAPFAESGHLLQQLRILRGFLKQLLAAFPGTRQVIKRQPHVEVLNQNLRVVRLQHAPLGQDALRQIKALALHRDGQALLQPGRIGVRVLEPVQFVGKHLRRLFAPVGRQQSIEGQLRVFTALGDEVLVVLELQINVRRTPRLLTRQIPLRGSHQRRPTLLGIAPGDVFKDASGERRCLQRQRQAGQLLQLRQRQGAVIDVFQPFEQALLCDRIITLHGHQRVQFKAIKRLYLRLRRNPAIHMLTRLGVITQTNQQIHQLQTQAIIFRVSRQQQLGIVSRNRIGLTTIGLEHGFTLEGRPQHTADGNRHGGQCPRVE